MKPKWRVSPRGGGGVGGGRRSQIEARCCRCMNEHTGPGSIYRLSPPHRDICVCVGLFRRFWLQSYFLKLFGCALKSALSLKIRSKVVKCRHFLRHKGFTGKQQIQGVFRRKMWK